MEQTRGSGPSTGFGIWLEAMRPKTLPAALVPVLAAAGLVWGREGIEWSALPWCLGFALLLQIGTNFANDYQDFRRGADTPERVGPVRAVASGRISEAAMARATAGVFAAAFLCGLMLIPHRGWELLPLGLVCLLAGYAYTGGPRPLAYNGLGDVFVVLFFGLVAVGGTHYVLTGSVNGTSLLCGLAIGLFANNLLVINNTRDRMTDGAAGKRTLAVRFGKGFSSRQLKLQMLIGFCLVPVLGWRFGSIWPMLAWLSLPLGIRICRQFDGAEGAAFNPLLARSAALLLIFGGLLIGGLLIGRA